MMKSPNEIAMTLREAGRKKTQLSLDRMFVLAMLAGAYIGFGAQLATTVSMDMIPRYGVGLTNLVSGTVFSVGLMLVILGGADFVELTGLGQKQRRNTPAFVCSPKRDCALIQVK